MKLETIESWAKIIGVCVAVFGVWKYWDETAQARVDRSVAYFDEYHQGDLLAARAEIAGLTIDWWAYLGANPDLTAEEIEAKMRADLTARDMRLNAEMVIEFYDRLAACAALDACDATTAKELFGAGEAEGFARQVKPLIDAVGRADPFFAAGLLCFAGARGDCAL